MAERRLNPAMMAMMLALAVVALGLTAFRARPLLDDTDELAHVASFASPADTLGVDSYGFWRPAKNLLFVLAHHAGLPAAHAVASVVFLLAVALAAVWYRRIGMEGLWALIAAAIWGLSPTQVSSVAWLSGVNIMGMAGLALLTLIGNREDARPIERAAGLLAFALALVSYEGAIVLPALWLLARWYRKPDGFRVGRSALDLLPLAAIAGAYLVIRHGVSGSILMNNESFPPDLAPAKLSAASAWFWWDHLSIWLWPFGRQSIFGSFVWPEGAGWIVKLSLSWAALLGVMLAAWLLRRRRPLLSFGLAWSLVAFLPTSNLIPLRCGPYGDYYLVLPGIGLALALTDLLRWLAQSPRVPLRMLAAALLLWRGGAAVLSFDWARAWCNEQLLLERSLAARPDAMNVKTALGRIYMNEGRLREARKLIEQAQIESPWCSQNLFVQGQLALTEKRYAEAKSIFTLAAARRPNEAYPPAALGFIAETLDHDIPAAKRLYRSALAKRWSVNSGMAAMNLGVLLAQDGDPAGARTVMEKALPKMGENPDLLRNLALACRDSGDMASAEKYFARHLRAADGKPQTTSP